MILVVLVSMLTSCGRAVDRTVTREFVLQESGVKGNLQLSHKTLSIRIEKKSHHTMEVLSVAFDDFPMAIDMVCAFSEEGALQHCSTDENFRRHNEYFNFSHHFEIQYYFLGKIDMQKIKQLTLKMRVNEHIEHLTIDVADGR
jgi:hypothetical protein